jgi:hypothetical protein
MLRLVSILSFAVVLTCLSVFTVAHAQSSNPNNTAPALAPPPMQCTNSAGTVRIDAVPISGNFPAPVSCPANTLGVTDCLKWQYRYTLVSGNNISLSAVTVDSDLDVVAARGGDPENGTSIKVYDPGSSDSAIQQIGFGIFDFRAVRFASQGTVVSGSVYTRTNVGISSVTAISKVGNTTATTCRIAGPGNIEGVSVGLAPVTTNQVDQFQECTISLTLDAKGCPTDVVATSNIQGVSCPVTEVTQPSLDGKPFKGGVCKGGTGLVFEGSTCVWYCPTSTGSCLKVCRTP